MQVKELQKKVEKIFNKYFGYTPLVERIDDITNEFFELKKWQDVRNLKEETGDLLSSVLQLCNENDWDAAELIENTLKKIETRKLQYQSLGRKTKVALYGGAFNPITIGHIQAAQFILNTSREFDEVWLVPAYNHMNGKKMESPEHRLKMCELAAKIDGRIKVWDYEIRNQLSGESYFLIKKLKLEEELNKKYNFSLVVGLDNANSFDTWVNYTELERMIRMVVIPRKGYEPLNNAWYFKEPHIYLAGVNGETPIMEVSSTDVRNAIKNFEDESKILKMIDRDVYNYASNNELYYVK